MTTHPFFFCSSNYFAPSCTWVKTALQCTCSPVREAVVCSLADDSSGKIGLFCSFVALEGTWGLTIPLLSWNFLPSFSSLRFVCLMLLVLPYQAPRAISGLMLSLVMMFQNPPPENCRCCRCCHNTSRRRRTFSATDCITHGSNGSMQRRQCGAHLQFGTLQGREGYR